ncbi:hypothetical protein XENOCAPTIV_008576, partial [Xenoophorus captivus]
VTGESGEGVCGRYAYRSGVYVQYHLFDQYCFEMYLYEEFISILTGAKVSQQRKYCVFIFRFVGLDCLFFLVPGAAPRRIEVEVLNSTALRVMWRSVTPGKQNGQIRGYQVHYVRVENGESRGLPLIKDAMLADAQV